MELLLQNHSSYPRVGDRPAEQQLRRARAAYERGALDAGELASVERAHLDAIMHEQAQAGLDILTDGQMRWADPISPLMGGLDGVHVNGLLRYFDTNCYFRQPVVGATLQRRRSILLGDFRAAAARTSQPVKPVLTGPYTLARHSLITAGAYRDAAALAHALAEVVAAEVGELAAAGARFIQIEEPSILRHPEDVRVLRRLLEPAWAARGGAQLVLATYFGDATALYAELNSLPADILALDFTYSPGLAEVVAATGASKVLALGLIDGRNTRLEDAGAIAAQVDAVLAHYTLDAVHLLPSCGLEYLPRDRARAKLGLLAAVRRALLGTL